MPYKNKADQAACAAKHYAANKQQYKTRAVKHTAESRNILRKFLWQWLLLHPCIDCGEKDPVVLEFDHRDGETKSFEIGSAAQKGYSLKKIEQEIEKCDVRCANCHRRRTAIQFGWYTFAEEIN